MKQFVPPIKNSNFSFSSKVKLMCFALFWQYVACRPTNDMVIDYRRNMDGMTIKDLCGKVDFLFWVNVQFMFLWMKSSGVAKYENGVTFPNLLLTCMHVKSYNYGVDASHVSKNSINIPTDESLTTILYFVCKGRILKHNQGNVWRNGRSTKDACNLQLNHLW